MAELKPEQQQKNPPPAPPHRRPRVREVSSRFMSPVTSPAPSPSSSSSTCSSPRHSDENRPTRAVTKLFKDHPPSSTSRSFSISRPDTPTIPPASSKFRHHHQHQHRSVSASASSSAAAKLLQSNLQTSSSSDNNTTTATNCKTLRSSMPEAANISSAGRFLTERNLNSATPIPPPPPPRPSSSSSSSNKVSRSLVLHPSASQESYSSLKIPSSPALCDANSRKSTTARSNIHHQHDIQSLRLLQNHYVQWRFVNAKAQSSALAQTRETQKAFYSLAVKLAELYESVGRKRTELAILNRTKALTTILDSQMPYLDGWSAIEADYSTSFTEATQALLNTSLKVPISGNIRADTREIGEALNSALKLMESIALQIQTFIPKAEETERLGSELAKMAGLETALIQECGDMLLYMTHKSQVEECSLRGQIIQFQRTISQGCQSLENRNDYIVA